MIDAKTIERLRMLESQATEAPWGWTTTGEKCNSAILGTFHRFDENCTPVGGHVERWEYDENKGDHVQVADWDEDIFHKDDNARYSDFEFVAEARNHLTALLDEIERLQAALKTAHEELLRVRTRGHGAAHELDNIAVEAGLGANPQPGAVAAYVRGLRNAPEVVQ